MVLGSVILVINTIMLLIETYAFQLFIVEILTCTNEDTFNFAFWGSLIDLSIVLSRVMNPLHSLSANADAT